MSKKPQKSTTISNCKFVGVQFDASAVEAVRTLAQGLLENAVAMQVLARVLNASEVKIETLLKIDSATEVK